MEKIAIFMAFILLSTISVNTAYSDEKVEDGNSTNESNVIKTHAFQIPWGKMDAELSKEVIKIGRYEMETVKMNISYEPYLIQFFPVSAEICLIDAPSWLSVIISTPQFYLQPREIKVIDIYLKVKEYVENGIQELVKFEIKGKNIFLPSLLEIDSCYASLVAIKMG
ncbi:MAG TPA: hypothetical protein ENI53_02525 [Thermoplasmatales archaeon]|nr:hypothetical protein [Thermoplasmatales archaeon]